MTPTSGPIWHSTAREHVADTLAQAVSDNVLTPAVTPLGGGMEHALSAYLVFAVTGSAHRYLLLERRNDDGEFAPLWYRAPAECDDVDADAPELVKAMARVGEYAEELRHEDLAAAGIVPDDEPDPYSGDFDDAMSTLLYGYRDVVAPHALD